MQASGPQSRCMAQEVGRPEMQQKQHLERSEGNHPGTSAHGAFTGAFNKGGLK